MTSSSWHVVLPYADSAVRWRWRLPSRTFAAVRLWHYTPFRPLSTTPMSPAPIKGVGTGWLYSGACMRTEQRIDAIAPPVLPCPASLIMCCRSLCCRAVLDMGTNNKELLEDKFYLVSFGMSCQTRCFAHPAHSLACNATSQPAWQEITTVWSTCGRPSRSLYRSPDPLLVASQL